MPELSEIHLFASLINEWSYGLTFVGTTRNPSAKSEDLLQHVSFDYTIFAEARGKELKLRLCAVSGDREVDVTFRHGLVGRWEWKQHSFPPATQIRFDARDAKGSLCYVDTQRMGRWSVGGFDMAGRGPDPLLEHDKFVKHVVSAAQSKPKFSTAPICEVMLDQKYFNGIGNYLRAEILYRSNTDPFAKAAHVIGDGTGSGAKRFFDMCFYVPNVVISKKLYKYGNDAEKQAFEAWLQCYGKGEFKLDSQKRKIYFFKGQGQGAVDSVPREEVVIPRDTPTGGCDDGAPAGSFAWQPLKPDKEAVKPLTHMLLVISVVWKQRLVSREVRAWLKEMALDGDEMLYCVLEAFLADEERDFDDLADTFSRLYQLSVC
eukprot:TRINITY_DN3509_c0_g1_i1.p1 TRINITY_DN3509_c0_g1~~TRINITY_DN3509_c0_g1_i1.p1  ORF type:complete len:403 (-),score=126.95 TRINITY_DN3509_c0_g1_i1:190-1311(-)